MKRAKKTGIVLLYTLFICSFVYAQDLDPRAYVKIPVDGNVVIAGYAHSHGNVLTDPTLPIENLDATVQAFTIGAARSFSLFGQTAQALAVLPYGQIDAKADVFGQQMSAKRTGFADMRFRLSALVFGGKAQTLTEYLNTKSDNQTLIGTSVTFVAPTGKYYSDKLINLSASRWAVKPEVALSQQFLEKWMIDFYAGVWFFTSNTMFYPDSSMRTQDPMVSFQSHLSYNVSPKAWVAFDATYYVGGQSQVNSIYKDDRVENSRIGATLQVPVGKRNAIKIAYSTGAVVRIGSNFDTFTIGWTTGWFDKPKEKKE